MQQPTIPGRHTFHVYQVIDLFHHLFLSLVSSLLQGECVIPWLNETLLCLNCAVQLCQQFRDKVSFFEDITSIDMITAFFS